MDFTRHGEEANSRSDRFVQPRERVVRIRTGEEDRAAVTAVGVPLD